MNGKILLEAGSSSRKKNYLFNLKVDALSLWGLVFMKRKKLKDVFLKKPVLVFLIINFAGGLSFCQFNPPVKDGGIFNFNLENDVWLKQDDGYTNGLLLGWISPQLDGEKHSHFLRFFYWLNAWILKGDLRKLAKV
ncbi:MAG: DUF2219 family protein, partial [Candidatus Aminicenantes bacterium]|nr:DUF2219 family protein [Candidatus Aminicenantes bacterium]